MENNLKPSVINMIKEEKNTCNAPDWCVITNQHCYCNVKTFIKKLSCLFHPCDLAYACCCLCKDTYTEKNSMCCPKCCLDE